MQGLNVIKYKKISVVILIWEVVRKSGFLVAVQSEYRCLFSVRQIFHLPFFIAYDILKTIYE